MRFVLCEKKMYRPGKPYLGVVRCFAAKHESVRSLEECADALLELWTGKNRYAVSFMLMQTLRQMKRYLEICCKNLRRLHCLGFLTRKKDLNLKWSQFFCQPIGSQTTFLRKSPRPGRQVVLYRRQGMSNQK
jgi:hypothetical protein